MSKELEKSPPRKRVLEPYTVLAEILFGLIMVLTFTGSLSVADAGRDDVRLIVQKGLVKSHGNYMRMLQTFNMPADDYKRFLNFLRKHQCQLSFQPFRSDTPAGLAQPIEPPPSRLAEAE